MMRQVRYKLKDSTLSDQELLYIVEECVEIAKKLQIYEEKNILRFILLQFAFSREQLESNLIRDAFTNTLTHQAWDEDKRLDFIYKNIVNRKQ
ncbi:hypothetical protein PN36_21260 [Candidatus Thiomargarita nelsonii]|uniref:Uncharacterized protein n=1 Tax=Candidatus Thiomargarita nelsonii TaxID=1003181 RepID=A0A0A6P9E6_9GAMM|nr:hypothetical protein PN36_21260 [Candidatus Thiomargarita nelsonii]